MIKEYFKAEYNLRGLEENSFNYDSIVLDKKYGKKINVCEWIDNLSVDGDLDGGIDYIVIDVDGIIIPLIEEDGIFEVMEDLLFNSNEENWDFKENITEDEQIKLIEEQFNGKKKKITIDFFQLKSGNSFQERVLDKIKTTVDDLIINEKYDSLRYSKKLVSNIKLVKKLVENISINDGAVEINFFYIANTDVKPKSMLLHEEIAEDIRKNIIKGFNHSNVNFKLYYGKNLIEFLNKTSDVKHKIQILNNDMLYKTNSYCIGLVKLKYLVDFVSCMGNLDLSLFDGNVRDSYRTSSKINKEIECTLTNEIGVNDFWWLNNGITIICKSMQKKFNNLYIEEPQIVNGLQSVVAIYDTLSGGNTLNSNKKIIVKILVENDSNNIDTIIKTTNTQNPVDDYLLSSTKPIHRDIEQSFLSFGEGYFYDRRKNYYKNLKKDKNRIFDIKYTFKTYASIFLGIPSQVRTATKKNFVDLQDSVFNSGNNKLAYLYSVLLDRTIQKVLKNAEIDDEFKKDNGVSIITYSLHLSYMYTSLIKKTLDFNDKFITRDDVLRAEHLEITDDVLQTCIKTLELIVKKYPNDNKVYLARSTKLEVDIKKEMFEIMKRDYSEK